MSERTNIFTLRYALDYREEKLSPYREHPVFKPPEDPDVKIWKYMDITKYLSLLDSRALYFARADILAEFDPFEGQYPKEIVLNLLDQAETEDEKNHLKKILGDTAFTKMLIINCWHINDIESYHMWKIYSKRNYGIVIQSTFNKLCARASEETTPRST